METSENDALYGWLILCVLLLIAAWRQRRDIRIHGQPDPSHRRRTYLFILLWLPLLIVIFLISSRAYIVCSLLVFVLCHVLEFGMGPQGLYRQLRDSAFVAWIISLPICFLLWINQPP